MKANVFSTDIELTRQDINEISFHHIQKIEQKNKTIKGKNGGLVIITEFTFKNTEGKTVTIKAFQYQ